MQTSINQSRKLDLTDWVEVNAWADEPRPAAKMVDHATSQLPITLEEFHRRRAQGKA